MSPRVPTSIRPSLSTAFVALATYGCLSACSSDRTLSGPESPTDGGTAALAAATPDLAARVQAPNAVRGVQAVMLACWSTASRNALVTTVKAANVPRFAIASLPFDASLCSPVDSRSRLGNLKAVVTELNNVQVGVDVIVHVGDFQDASPHSRLAARMEEIWSDIIVPFAGRATVRISVSPSLEDNLSAAEAATAYSRLISGIVQGSAQQRTARQATLAALVRAGRFRFVRNPLSCAASTDAIRIPGTADVIPVVIERHGASPTSCRSPEARLWSNDGPFVSNESPGYLERGVGRHGAPGCGRGASVKPIAMTVFRSTPFGGDTWGCCGAPPTTASTAPRGARVALRRGRSHRPTGRAPIAGSNHSTAGRPAHSGPS